VGHVHAAFTEIKAELVEESMSVLNEEMLTRPARRAEFKKLWRIGEPYRDEPIATVELQLSGRAWNSPPPYAAPVADWNPHSLTQTVGRAVLGALREANLVKTDGELHIEERAGGYVRAFIENASDDDSRLFNTSLEEVLAPLDRPRYVIRRFVDYRIDTWLSRLLPEVLGRYFRRKRSAMEMVHALPRALAKNKQLAAIFGKHWNAHVSKGQPVFVRSQEGKRLVEHALQEGRTPMSQFHHKDVFV